MKARKYWNVTCISWKEYRIQCEKILSWASDNSLTAEEFGKYNPALIDTTEFLESQDTEEFIGNMVTTQEWEKIEAKCKDIYGEAYEEECEECREAYGWFN